MGVFHLALYISSSLFYFCFIIGNAKPTCIFFKLYDAKHYMLNNWSKQCPLEVSAMVTELVSGTILFPTKKLCL